VAQARSASAGAPASAAVAALPRTTDMLVVGGGIIGLTLALEFRRRHPDCGVTLIEKEAACGLHASGRNSGVLHAGFYYTPDSLKARFTRDGNRALTEYCERRGLPLRRCGKLVVARSRADLAGLDDLLRRGRANGITLEAVTADEARRIEPRARTHERALFSPTTASVSPAAVIAALVADARSAGITVATGTAYRGRAGGGRGEATVRTSSGPIAAGYVINAAGLYADRIARQYGFADRYRIVPFKGAYLYGDRAAPGFRVHIYPVPDVATPFLGVHVTALADGGVKLGPTATPAFWREHYAGLGNFSLRECLEVARLEAGFFARNDFGFRDLAVRELSRGRRRLVQLAAELATGLDAARFRRWGPAGIRAQLVDVNARTLEMDFAFEGDDRSFHVLNAVSPAFTCALPMSAYLVDRVEQHLG